MVPGAFDVDIEEFPLDRTVDASGNPIMDVSHEDARWLRQDEFLRVLGVPLRLFAPITPSKDDGKDE